METATYQCVACSKPFEARTADRKRGWARFCSKSCKATQQNRKKSWLQRKPSRKGDFNFWDQMDEHEAILDDLGETADDKWGDSGLN